MTERVCELPSCAKPLVRHTHEDVTSWHRRRFCSAKCARNALKMRFRASVEATRERPRWRKAQ